MPCCSRDRAKKRKKIEESKNKNLSQPLSIFINYVKLCTKNGNILKLNK
jgi:hypothetical protein